ncbi:MAG: DUF3108 domain-containing protein [Gammaproteobacteria bacterium]|nr:DUF3108 domain-containing protein [Gammaproteobacteria bacterium]
MKNIADSNNLIKRLTIALITSALAGGTIAGIVLAGFAHAADGQPVVIEFTAYYKVVKGGITVGETKRSLKAVKPGTYEFSSETSPRGVFSWFSDAYVFEQSQWRMAGSEFVPLEYNYHNINDEKVRDVKLLFDWNKNRVTNIINGDPWHMALHAGLQDKLLFQLKMMQDLQNGAEQLTYSVADGGKIKEYIIEKIGDETLKIPLGEFAATKLQRVTENKTTIWWCAEQLLFLPIKIQQKKHEGGRATAVLYKLEGIAVPQPPPSPEESPKP